MRAETEVAGAPTGGMDQTVAMFAEPGAALLIDFLDHTTRAVPARPRPTPGWPSWSSTPGSRTRWSTAGTPADVPTARPPAASSACRPCARPTLDRVEALTDSRIRRRARHVVTEIDRVAGAVAALERADWPAVGELFVASHASMRDDFEISCPELDVAVEAALAAGAVGARMTGGGFGGSAVALVPADALDAVTAAVDAAFDDQGFRRPAYLRAEPSAAAGLC